MVLTNDRPLLLHNPSCSKSRALHAALEERGLAFDTRAYLDDSLNVEELTELLARLRLPAAALLRSKEPEFAQAGLTKDASDAELLAAIARYPRLLERPVLVLSDRAAIGRPAPENALAIL